jgi:N-acetylglucosaminyl-diphospho-decaprenol L-rhamnosyltransferase
VRVTAIVVAHNSARDLPESLGCLRDLPVQRSVVVDNASTDGSADLARRYTPHVLCRPNDGFGAALNAAAGQATDAEAYLFLNPDCRIGPESYRELVAALRDQPGCGAAAPLMRYPDGRYGISAGPEPSMLKEWLAALRADHLVPRGVKASLLRSPRLRARLRMVEYLDTRPPPTTRAVAWVSGFCMLVRAEAFRQVGGFDPAFFLYFEDVDLCRRLRAGGWGVASVGASAAEHKESTSTAVAGKRRLYRSGMLAYFTKHGTRRQRFSARLLRITPI